VNGGWYCRAGLDDSTMPDTATTWMLYGLP
jgi:hypothetical protein